MKKKQLNGYLSEIVRVMNNMPVGSAINVDLTPDINDEHNAKTRALYRKRKIVEYFTEHENKIFDFVLWNNNKSLFVHRKQ